MRHPIQTLFRLLVLLLVASVLSACTNNPYRPSEAGRNIYYDTFSEEPKHLDPARAYSSDEYTFINQILDCCDLPSALEPYSIGSDLSTSVALG